MKNNRTKSTESGVVGSKSRSDHASQERSISDTGAGDTPANDVGGGGSTWAPRHVFVAATALDVKFSRRMLGEISERVVGRALADNESCLFVGRSGRHYFRVDGNGGFAEGTMGRIRGGKRAITNDEVLSTAREIGAIHRNYTVELVHGDMF